MTTRDVLYREVDDSCALCGQRGSECLTVHHIDGDRTNNTYDNQIVLCHNCHHRYHNDKGITHTDIEDRKRRLIEKTLTQYGVNALKISYRNRFGVVAMPFLLYHLVELGYMSEEETGMTYGDGVTKVGVNVRFAITDAGCKLYERWFK